MTTRVCVYDNPATMQRECWQNGALIRAYSAVLYALKEWPVPAEYYFFGANIGDWISGQLIGDWMAMENPPADRAGGKSDPPTDSKGG